MTPLRSNLREFWRRLSRSELAAMIVLLAGLTVEILRIENKFSDFLKYAAVISFLYLVVRVIAWGRSRLLWSLRNRLIVAYLFIALVPVLLILSFFVLASNFLYTQLGAFLLSEDLHRRIGIMTDIRDHIAASRETIRNVKQEE